MSEDLAGNSGPQPTGGSNITVTSGGAYVQSGSSTGTFAQAVQATDDAPLVTDAPAADEAVVDPDAPVPVVATVRREERHAVLTVNGVETVLSQHDAQVLWRELNVALAVL